MEGPDIAEGELDRGDSEASELSDRVRLIDLPRVFT